MKLPNGHIVDIVAAKPGKKIAIEIETGKSDAKRNERRCKEAGVFDEIICLSTLN